MNWFLNNLSTVGHLTWLHLLQSVLPVVLGTLVSIPIARFAAGRRARGAGRATGRAGGRRRGNGRVRRGVVVNAAALLYTIPSLALFVLLPLILGTSITSLVNVIVALTLYVVAMMVRACVDAFESVSPAVLDAATSMGYRPLRSFFGIELPLSVPVMAAGLRVALVSNISMVSVGAVIGIQSLGTLFTDGLRRDLMAEIVVGILATVLLALVLDRVITWGAAAMTRWQVRS
ncbi:ABC transporter permease subunit [Rothia sp. AR01]|uniref:ABC transporter permease subunit n=1 Tax=Rothia santali TaxID=2949643 RepID=A0A9X2HF69_9MICC|nr:ABC transporter permease subunit [Rothia santali]MCP3425657.1 ABC transporter permease subunit [Rothia santali]